MTLFSIKIGKKIVKAAALLLALITIAIPLASCSGERNTAKPEGYYYAELKNGGKKLSVNAPINSDDRDVYLFAIDPWQSHLDLSGLEPLKKAKIKNSEASATLNLKNYDLSEMVCKGYVFGMISEDESSYTPVSSVYYVYNPGEISVAGGIKDESALTGNLKGLIGTPAELLDVGASSTLITVDLGKLLSDKGGIGTYSFVFNGITCHVNESELDALDSKIKAFTEARVSVYLEIIQTKSSAELGERISSLAFDGLTEQKGYAFNMKDRDGATLYCAAIKLLAERYSGKDHGRADSFIIGRTVNKAQYYADTLEIAEEKIENYSLAVRMAYNLVVSHNASGKVYASIGNNWTLAEPGGWSAKDYFTAFSSISEDGGDFYWQLSIEANASDTSSSRIWDDNMAVEGQQFVSPADLSRITTLLSSSSYKCNGLIRNLVLNRFAIAGENEEEQAASYAYAYYTALASGRVNALIYARVADDSLHSGLYHVYDGLVSKKNITTVFENVDNIDATMPDYVGNLIGASWKDIYPATNTTDQRHTTVAGAATAGDRETISTIADFSGGDDLGFVPISANYTELHYDKAKETNVLYAELAAEGITDSAGVITDDIDFKSFKKAGYLTMHVKADSSGATSVLRVKLSGTDKKGVEHTYISETTITSGVWTDVYYNVESFIDEVNSDTVTLSITVSPAGAGETVQGLSISEIKSEAPDKAEFPLWIIWVALGVLALVGIVIFIVWFKKNYTFVRE